MFLLWTLLLSSTPLSLLALFLFSQVLNIIILLQWAICFRCYHLILSESISLYISLYPADFLYLLKQLQSVMISQGLTTSACCSADFTGWRPLSESVMRSLFWHTMSKQSGTKVPIWWTVSTSRHSSQMTTTFCLISVFGHLMCVHCRRQSICCCGRSSVEQSSITHHYSPPLSIFCCRLKSHLFSLSYRTFLLFCHLYSACAVTRHFRHYNCHLI